ncbi:HIT family protein [Saccharothrix sp. 6-C]|uniref:Histidine triad (HIT) family protein n=1 Tax=Saccharothrix texasensis TaxID=103734 RepID=A0A3N1H9E0_9PSEU|nr:HIT family protein [Saccharothrix texasensis]QQQ76611.1 HIT family protein [Saccharothrix sp. 6-C]ROP39147.1 histidine triad (HIT) family protein [Saccharothrix texasensis]
MRQDWYCDEVIPGSVEVEVVAETATVLAFRPPRPGFGREHVIVVPKAHVGSLLDLEPDLAAEMMAVLQQTAAEVVARHGGCQVLTTLGDEQHNQHLHWHVAAGDGVARFVPTGGWNP